MVSPTSTTAYSVTVTGGPGCVGKATTTVTVNPAVQVSISPASATLCTGTSTNLTASGGSGYTWNTGETTATISVSAAGPYSVTATTSGCSSVTTATITLQSGTSIVTQPAAGSVVCVGTPVRAGVIAGGVGPFTYQWYQDGLLVANQTDATLTLNAATVGQSGSLLGSGHGSLRGRYLVGVYPHGRLDPDRPHHGQPRPDGLRRYEHNADRIGRSGLYLEHGRNHGRYFGECDRAVFGDGDYSGLFVGDDGDSHPAIQHQYCYPTSGRVGRLRRNARPGRGNCRGRRAVHVSVVSGWFAGGPTRRTPR